jgi:hypothetical protein
MRDQGTAKLEHAHDGHTHQMVAKIEIISPFRQHRTAVHRRCDAVDDPFHAADAQQVRRDDRANRLMADHRGQRQILVDDVRRQRIEDRVDVAPLPEVDESA